MPPKRTTQKQTIRDLREQLIASRHEAAQLRRELADLKAAALTLIATFGTRDTHDTIELTVE